MNHEEKNKASREQRAKSRRSQLRAQAKAINYWVNAYNNAFGMLTRYKTSEDIQILNNKIQQLQNDVEFWKAEARGTKHWFWGLFK